MKLSVVVYGHSDQRAHKVMPRVIDAELFTETLEWLQLAATKLFNMTRLFEFQTATVKECFERGSWEQQLYGGAAAPPSPPKP